MDKCWVSKIFVGRDNGVIFYFMVFNYFFVWVKFDICLFAFILVYEVEVNYVGVKNYFELIVGVGIWDWVVVWEWYMDPYWLTFFEF